MSASRVALSPPAPERPLAQPPVPSEVFIDQQIRRTRRQVKWVEIFQGILILVVSGLGFLFLTALLDHWVVQGGLPHWARWVLWAGLAGWSVGYFWVKVLPLIVYRIHPLYAAQTIESAQPSLRNNLINFLFLRKDPRGVPEPVLRAVKEATARQLVDVASESVVDRQPVIRLGYVLVVVVGLVAFYLVLSPKNPLISFGRVLWPWADIPAPTRVQIEAVDPGDITVPRGEAVQVSAQVRGLADEEEVLFYYSTADGQIVEQAIPMKPTDPGLPLYRLPVDSFVARQDTHYFIQAGDARSRTFTIQVEIPLVITAERLVYEYPQYTGLGRSVVQGQGDIRAVEGTKVTIEASANQPLAQAEIDLDGQGRWRVPMRVEGQSARGQLTLRTHPDDPLRPEYTSYLLRAQTVEGEVNRRPTRYMIEVLPDRPPRVDLRLGALEEVPEEIQLSRSRTVEMRVEAEDSDFGLRRVAIQLQKQGRMLEVPPLLHWPSVPKSPDPKTPSTKLSGRQGPEGHQGVFQAGWQFNPAALGLNPKDVVFYWARVEDTKLPTPNVAETPRRRIVIVEDTTSQPHPSQESSPNQQGQGQTPPAPGQESPTPPDQSQMGEQEKSSPSDQPAGKEPTPPQSAKEPSSDSSQPKEPSSTDSAEQHAGSDKPESAGKSEPTAKTSPGQGEASSDQAGSEEQEAAKEESQPKGASKPEESQKPQESQKPEENQKPENSQKPEAGENSEGQQKPASGPQTEGGQQGTSGSGKPEPQSGQTSSQPTPSGQNGSASPSQSSPASSPQTPQSGSGQPGSGETSATQGAEPSTATGSKTPPQRIDPVSNPGKAFEEILRDRAEQQTSSTQEAGKPSGPSDSSPSQSKPTPQESGVPPDTPPGSRASEQPGTKPDGVEKAKPETVEHTGEQQQGTSSEKPEEKSPSGASAPGEKTKPSPSAGGSDVPAGQEKPTPAVAKPIPGQPKSSAPEQSAQTKSSPEQGAPEAQEANQPRLGPSGQKPPDSESENQAQSPSISKRQSDSRGDQEGDRSGGGQQGGGQQAPQHGAGTPGSQSPANEGAGTSNQPGPGEQGTRAGEQVQSPQPTGSPGEKRGASQSTQEPGSEAKSSNMPPPSSKPQPTSEKPEGSETKRPETKPPKTLPEGPERPVGSSDHPGVPRQGTSPEKPTAHGAGNPQTGGMPSQSSGPPMPNEPLRGDDPNLEYTRQAVDMALEHLRDRLREGDLRILEKLRWSQEDAESFLRRWEELKRQASEASPGSPAQKQLQEVLKNLGLRPQGTSRPGNSAKPDDLRRLRETRTVPPPPDWAEQFRAFRRSVRGEEE